MRCYMDERKLVAVEIDVAGGVTVGRDVAGWTLDGYVIPRLGSGGIVAREVTEEELAGLLPGWASSAREGS